MDIYSSKVQENWELLTMYTDPVVFSRIHGEEA